jgi:plasmid stabilization system protein ParE
MLPVKLVPQARRDIKSFYRYIAKDDSNVANLFLECTEETQSIIGQFPLIAATFETENPTLAGVRWLPIQRFSNHLLFYIPEETHLTIPRILHKSQNIEVVLF